MHTRFFEIVSGKVAIFSGLPLAFRNDEFEWSRLKNYGRIEPASFDAIIDKIE